MRTLCHMKFTRRERTRRGLVAVVAALAAACMAGTASADNPNVIYQLPPAYTAADEPMPPVGAAGATGKLFLKDLAGGTFYCTAFVINTLTDNLIATAGHCLNEGGRNGSPGRYFTIVNFVPSFNPNGTNPYPYGSWTPVKRSVSASWLNYGNNHDDFGAVQLALNKYGQKIEEVVPAIGYRVNIDRGNNYRPLMRTRGYADNRNSGTTMRYCRGYAGGYYEVPGASVAPGDGNFWAFGCDLRVGSSGGPVVDGEPSLLTLVSFADPEANTAGSSYKDTLYGPYLNQQFLDTLGAAK